VIDLDLQRLIAGDLGHLAELIAARRGADPTPCRRGADLDDLDRLRVTR
jgi:hypothetical protein